MQSNFGCNASAEPVTALVMELFFTPLAVVAAVAFAAPLALGLSGLRLPAWRTRRTA